MAVTEHGVDKQIDNTKGVKNAPCGSSSAPPLCSKITGVTFKHWKGFKKPILKSSQGTDSNQHEDCQWNI